LWAVRSVSLLQIKNASISLGKYLDWSLCGILCNGAIRGRRKIHSFPFLESLGDRLMNSNRETYRSIFGMREKKRRLKISSCMVGDPLDKVKSAYKEDGWNDLVVIAKGPTVIQKINGVVFSQLSDHDEKYSTSKGWIAFQDHGKGTKVEFKNIRIRIDQ
jgi:hypothetical protein